MEDHMSKHRFGMNYAMDRAVGGRRGVDADEAEQLALEAAAKYIHDRKTDIVMAFSAQYDMLPSECEMVLGHDGGFSVRRKVPTLAGLPDPPIDP